MSESPGRPPDAEDLPARLERAHERLERAEERVEEFGHEDLEELADAYDRFVDLLDRYEDQVVGDEGDFETNIEFQGQIADIADDLTEDMLLYETFAECDEYLQRRWFNQSHFDHVREQLEPVGDLAGRIEEYDEALAAYRDTRRQIRQRIRNAEDQVDHLERLSRLGEADLDAPTERLRKPIEAYNEAIEAAYAEFRRDAAAREVMDFLDAMAAFPLVSTPSPPADLFEYIASEPPGEETIPQLLDYADYSRSKLDHYVEDPDRLKHVIGGQQTFLSGLSAEPLQIAWPPPSATALRWRCEELTAAVNRLAPSVVEELRAVEALPRETDYERIRNSATAEAELTAEERTRLADGDVEAELAETRAELEALRTALEDFPDR